MLKTHKLNIKYISLIGIVYIYTTFNNTLITITDFKGKTLTFGSSGILGLKGSKRSTAYAGQSIATVLGKNLFNLGIKFLQIKIKGFGNARKSVLKGFLAASLKIISIKDVTAVSHNGCRKRKKRRI